LVTASQLTTDADAGANAEDPLLAAATDAVNYVRLESTQPVKIPVSKHVILCISVAISCNS